ncbi:hypothetical protein PTKIN_Ptkin03bG0097900 [Pterospermum kingtungense]
MLGVCTPNLQFVYVLPSWEGLVADSRVLRNAITRRHGLKVSNGHQSTTPEEFFNMKHADARNVIKRCFGLLKTRREMSFDPIDVDVGENLHSDVIVEEDPIICIDPSDAWSNWRLELANKMFNEWCSEN